MDHQEKNVFSVSHVPKTDAMWQKYNTYNSSIGEFLPVLNQYIQELEEYPDFKHKIDKIFAEAEHYISHKCKLLNTDNICLLVPCKKLLLQGHFPGPKSLDICLDLCFAISSFFQNFKSYSFVEIVGIGFEALDFLFVYSGKMLNYQESSEFTEKFAGLQREILKIFPDLLLNYDGSVEDVEKIVFRVATFSLPTEKLQIMCRDEFLKILDKFLVIETQILQAFFPNVLENPDLIDMKHMLKFVYMRPSQVGKAFEVLLRMFHTPHCNSQLVSNEQHDICFESPVELRELTFLIRFSLKDVTKPQEILKFIGQNSIEIVLKYSDRQLSVEIIRKKTIDKKNCGISHASIKPGEAINITYSHSTSLKVSQIKLNDQEFIETQDLLKNFNQLSKIKINFEGNLNYLLVYDQSKAKMELQPYIYNYSLLFKAVTEKLDLGNHLIFVASSENQHFYRAHQIKLREKSKNLFDLFKQLGGLNCIIPILSQSFESTNFAHLFFVLTDFTVSMKSTYLTELFSEDFFRALRILMIKNVRPPCIELVKSIELFILQQSDTEILKIVIDNILINCDLWAKVEENNVLIAAFNIFLKIKSDHYENLFIDPIKILEMVKFFVNVKQEIFMRSFLFEILKKIVGKFVENHGTLINVLKIIVENMNSQEEGEHLFNFLILVSENLKKKSNTQEFDSINFCKQVVHDVFPSLRKESYLDFAVISFVLNVFSNHIQVFKKDSITIRLIDFKMNYSKEFEFYKILFQELEFLTFNINNEEFLDIMFKFSEKWVIKQIVRYAEGNRASILTSEEKIPEFFDLVTSKFFSLFTNRREKFKETLNSFENYIKKNNSYLKRIVESSSFPKWSYKFFETYEKAEIRDFYEFFLGIFTNLKIFKNFSALRKLIFYFKDSERYNGGLDFYLWIINHEDIKADSELFKVFYIELLNIFEDISLVYDTKTETYVKIVEGLLILYRSFGEKNYLSLSFPRIIYNQEHENREDFPNKDKIFFREGGIARQLLLFIFNAMKWKRFQFLENEIIHLFTSFKLTPKPVEFKKLKDIKHREIDKSDYRKKKQQEFYIKKVKVLGKKLKFDNPENLILIYAYFEWSQCLFNYSPEDKEVSEKNLKVFVNGTDFKKKLKVLNLKNNSLKQILIELRTLTPECQTLCESYKIKPFVSEDEIKKLGSSINTFKNNFEKFILIEDNENALRLLIFYLTSFKLNSLSKRLSIGYFKDSELRIHINLEQRKSSISYLRYINFYQVESEQIYKNVIKRYSDIFEVRKAESLKYSLRSLTDALGRRVFIHKNSKKYKDSPLRKHSLDNSILLELKRISSLKTDYTDIDRQASFASSEDLFIEESKIFKNELEVDCEIINVYGFYYGTLSISDKFILFQCKNIDKPSFNPVTDSRDRRVFTASMVSESQIKEEFLKIWKIEEIKEIVPRRFLHVYSAIEIYFYSGKTKYFNFYEESKCNKVKNFLSQFKPLVNIKESAERSMEDWRRGKLSNFEYLMALNKLSGRSFNDISQYPVFPWVLKNFETSEINLSQESNYRDLSLPVACQNEYGREKSKKTYETSKNDDRYPYHHGSHYSNGGIVLHFMLRIEPYSQQSKNLQGGSFDVADRLFLSLEISWKGSQAGYGDCKELIPELFYLPEIFVNKNREDFSRRQNGHLVDNLLLPPWAKNSVFKFLQIHRKALESQIVSEKLPCWINLVFGSHQSRKEAETCFNLFHPVTYDFHYKNILMNCDKSLHQSFSQQVQHFGQTPIKLFENYHKSKKEILFKETLAEKLLRGESPSQYLLTKLRFYGKVLINSNYLVIVNKETPSFSKFSFNEKLPDSERELELKNIRYKNSFLAEITNDDRIITCEELSNCINIHNLSGDLIEKVRICSSSVTCLAAGPVIAVGCNDSSLTVLRGNTEHLRLFGHLQRIEVVIISEIFCSVISATNQSILIHDYRSGDILTHIQHGGSKLACNNFGCICVEFNNQLSFFYINGDEFRTKIEKNIDWWVLAGDCVWFSAEDKQFVGDVFWDHEPIETIKKIDVRSEFGYNEKLDIFVWIRKSMELLRAN